MLFAGLTSVIAKAGLKNVASDTALAVRTVFIFAFIWLNILVFNSTKDFANVTKKDILLLGVSGLTTSLSWIFYYKDKQKQFDVHRQIKEDVSMTQRKPYPQEHEIGLPRRKINEQYNIKDVMKNEN